MKTKNPFTLLSLCLLSLSAISQNWSVFNPLYRYNYKYNNNNLVTQVLFADSSKVAGGDTSYYLNRIGFECIGSFPTFSVSVGTTANIVIPNVPQFLQGKIVKYSNGTVGLLDTANLLIKPACQPTQSWLFDAVNNVTATCISKTQKTSFGFSDSLKLILIGSNDTLLLSKHFGILQFPNLYNKNKYYRLVGIEYAASYDSTSLYGEKVPNAWDFYRYDVGDKFCYQETSNSTFHTAQYIYTMGDFTVLSKTTVANAYVYSISGSWASTSTTGTLTSSNSGSGFGTVITPGNLSSALFENKMYPGKIIESTRYNTGSSVLCSGMFCSYNLVKFGKDNQGTFFKYAGLGCSTLPSSYLSFIPATTALGLEYLPAGYLRVPLPGSGIGKYISEVYGVGLGKLAVKKWQVETGESYDYCQTCAIKKGSLYYGTETFVGIDEVKINDGSFKLYPNPTSGLARLHGGNQVLSEIRVSDMLGRTVLILDHELDQNDIEINLSTQQAGLYFVQIFNKDGLMHTEKLIKN